MIGRMLGLRSAAEDDATEAPYPLQRAFNQCNSLSAIRAGGTIVFPERFSASLFMADAAAHHATQVIGVMAMASAILGTDGAGDPPRGSIDKAIWIPLDEPRQKQFEARFGCRINSEGYGQSEATAICLNPFDSAQRRVGTLGRPTSIVDVAVVDDDDHVVPDGQVGEIVVRPRVAGAIFSGYWQRPAETLAAWRNLWYHTGDYGRREPDGFFSFVDRKKDAVRWRGENVSSVELERIVMSHPQIVEAAVHAALGEDDIKVCIVALTARPQRTSLRSSMRSCRISPSRVTSSSATSCQRTGSVVS